MVVDDHTAVRRGVRELIETSPKFSVVAEAASGHDALREARRANPDIAIVDYSLPELNGTDLTVALKRELPNLTVLIYTMHTRDEIIDGILKAGARGYVLKSESEIHLLAALNALASGEPYFSHLVTEALLDEYLESKADLNVCELTQRERQILQLIAEGQSNKALAYALGIKIKTAECHRSSAMHKIEATTVADIVRFAVRNNLIEP
jgi:DNA-binding NarL/FixJ family response regulator